MVRWLNGLSELMGFFEFN